MTGEFGYDELIEAHAFGFRFAGQGGVERFGQAHVELAAVLTPPRTARRLVEPVVLVLARAVSQRIGRPRLLIEAGAEEQQGGSVSGGPGADSEEDGSG